jgi:iron complex outermembrane receptor protein
MYKKFALLVLSAGVIATDVYAADENSQALQAIVVTGSGVKQNTAHSKLAKSTTVLSGETLRTNMGQTLGATLQNQLGVSSQSFGAGVGTPVIRGQSGTRVRVMQNSLGNNDASSLSPDHANGVDPLIAERIEVLRGASTLLYGSGAMGGIVNVIDNRIPEQMPTKLIGGAAEQRYDSVSDATASAVKLEGGKDLLPIIWMVFTATNRTPRLAAWRLMKPLSALKIPVLTTYPLAACTIPTALSLTRKRIHAAARRAFHS